MNNPWIKIILIASSVYGLAQGAHNQEFLDKTWELAPYAPGLIRGLGASAEYIVTGDLTHAWGSFLDSLTLLGYGNMVPYLIKYGQENPRYIPAIIALSPHIVTGVLKSMGYLLPQNSLEKAQIYNSLDKMKEYGVNIGSALTLAGLGYTLPSFAQWVQADPWSWRGAVALSLSPALAYTFARYGIISKPLKEFLIRNPTLGTATQRWVLGSLFPAIAAGKLYQYYHLATP